MITIGGIEAVGWGAAAVWKAIELGRDGKRQEWGLVVGLTLVALGWVSAIPTRSLLRYAHESEMG